MAAPGWAKPYDDAMKRWATISVVTMAILLSSCGKDATSSSSSIFESTQSSNPASSNQESTGVDDFTSPVVGGGSFVLSNALANKPVVLWFWAPGWGTCNAEAPSVEEVHKEFADTVSVVGVAWAGDNASYQSFVDRHGLTFANLDDTSGDVYAKYKVPYQPAWMFIDAEGTVTPRVGSVSVEEVSELIQNLN